MTLHQFNKAKEVEQNIKEMESSTIDLASVQNSLTSWSELINVPLTTVASNKTIHIRVDVLNKMINEQIVINKKKIELLQNQFEKL